MMSEQANFYQLVGEITICTEAAVTHEDAEHLDKTIFVIKKHPEKTKREVEMSLINPSVLTGRDFNSKPRYLISVLHFPIEGFEDLSGFKRISTNVGIRETSFLLDAIAQTDEPKRVKLKIIMLFEQEGRKLGE